MTLCMRQERGRRRSSRCNTKNAACLAVRAAVKNDKKKGEKSGGGEEEANANDRGPAAVSL